MRWCVKLREYLKEFEEFEPSCIAPPRYFTPYRNVCPRWDRAIKVRLPELGHVVLAVLWDLPPGMASLAVQDDSWFLGKGRTIVSFSLSNLTEVSPQAVLWRGLTLWKKNRVESISQLLCEFAD
jgi:hypothetical protein